MLIKYGVHKIIKYNKTKKVKSCKRQTWSKITALGSQKVRFKVDWIWPCKVLIFSKKVFCYIC